MDDSGWRFCRYSKQIIKSGPCRKINCKYIKQTAEYSIVFRLSELFNLFLMLQH